MLQIIFSIIATVLLTGVQHHQMVCALFQLGLGLTQGGFLVFIHFFGLILAQAAAEVGEVRFDAVLLVLIQLLLAFGKSLVHLVGQHLGLIVQV